MSASSRRFVTFPVALAIAVLGGAAGAQPLPSAPGVAAKAAGEAEARAHFKRGDDFRDDKAWSEALSEYRQSHSFVKTKGAMANIALCLRQLGEYDEALDAYEALRREFPKLPAKMEAEVAPAMAELQGLVGTLVVTGDAPAGASLFIDDRLRGTLPLAAPLRLRRGHHALRVVKEGFAPIVAGFDIAAGKENVIPLEAKSREGRLRVSEKHNWVLEVEVDGKVVGKTPWEGLVAPGDHAVRVHGFVRSRDLAECTTAEPGTPEPPPGTLDRAEMASPTATASVKAYEVTSRPLAAEDLDASLRIEATPADAAVAIDGKAVSQGNWLGRLPLGAHRVEITARGFMPVTRAVRLERRQQREIQIDLAREPRLGVWGPKRNAAVGGAYALGAAGITAGTVTGIEAIVKNDAIKAHCDVTGILCPKSQRAAADTATSFATASTVSLVVGGAGLVLGTALVIWYRPDEPRSGRSSAMVWSADVGLGRFELRGRF
jgi:PEGA domain